METGLKYPHKNALRHVGSGEIWRHICRISPATRTLIFRADESRCLYLNKELFCAAVAFVEFTAAEHLIGFLLVSPTHIGTLRPAGA